MVFFDGRLKSAGLDQDSGLMNSAYLNGRINLFNKYCRERVNLLETDVAAVCTEAETLLIELASMPAAIRENEITETGSVKQPKRLPASLEEAQSVRADVRKTAKANEDAERLKAVKSQMQKRRIEILQRLVQIRDRISNRETSCSNELSASAFTLKERLCVYGHGVLLRPVLNRYIPPIEHEWAFDLYHKNHKEILCRISCILEEEGNENA